jgi:phosphoribosylformylglycinamidine cyclo-ligase
MSLTYHNAGVDIDAGERLVDRIKPMVRRTMIPGVMSDVGLFGGLFDARFEGYEHPVLVASTDGVGTKLKVAVMANRHTTIGTCLVNHCVNDILACGAKPLFFLDYFATGKLSVDVAADVVSGLAAACEENGCALLGGETAEMPSMYADGEYDLAGTIVGVVEKSHVLNGSRVSVGNILIGLPSNGLHTNGYSLARAALFPTYDVNAHIDALGTSLADALLAPHKSYYRALWPLLEQRRINALAHVTGGGLIGNTSRVLGEGMALKVEWDSWQRPPIFDLIQTAGSIDDAEMRRAFNLGIGMIAIVEADAASEVIRDLYPHGAFVVGEVVSNRA